MDGAAAPFPGADEARDWPVLAAALARRDPAAAAEMWRRGIPRPSLPARPLAAFAAAEIAARLPEAESAAWTAEIGGKARAAVEAEIASLDPESYGFPAWPSAEAALFPASPGGEEGMLEAATMLVREAAALRRLGADSPVADGEEAALRDMLASRVWDEDFMLFSTPDGREADFTPGGLFPVVLAGLDEPTREASAERAGEVFSRGDWTAEGTVVFALLAGEGRLVDALAAKLRPCGVPWEEAWQMLCGPAAEARRSASKRVAWIGGAVAAALAAAALWAGGRTGAPDAAGAEEAAKELCRAGRHEAAAAAYAELGGACGRFREAGEWLHAGEPAKAEPLYRALLAAGEGGDSVRMNLALSLHRAGKTQEARDAYRAIAEGGGPAAHAAGKAADILEDLLALSP